MAVVAAALPDPDTDPAAARDRRAWHERVLLAAVRLAVGVFGDWSRCAAHRRLDREQRHLLEIQARAVDDLLSRQLAGVAAALRGVGTEVAVLPDDPVAVHADSTQLQPVLLNPCTNAWHALPEQGGRIEVGFERTRLDTVQRQRVPGLPPGPCVHLWVSDDGSGIDDATRQRIFDPFFTTKTVGRGTGLGLPVVLGIVRAHDGTIALDTALGPGSTFPVDLPIAANASAPEPDTAPAPEAARAGAGQRVLYIDDDEVMVLLVQRLLERAGFQVDVDTEAGRALERLRSRPTDFDVVVTDVNMPHLSGLDVAATVAALRHDLPVVISSGHVSDDLRSKAEAAGVRARLRKEHNHANPARLLREVLAAGSPG